MPNSFLGFPVRRALLADYAKSTDVLASLYDATGVNYLPTFDSMDGMVKSPTGDGTIAITDGYPAITLPGNGGAAYLLQRPFENLPADIDWTTRKRFKAQINVYAATLNDAIYWLTIGSRLTSNHVGFCILGGKLYASVGGGGVNTKSLALLDHSGGEYSFTARLEIDFIPGSAKFYVDSILAATIITGLPTGTDEAKQLMTMYANEGSGSNLTLFSLYRYQAYSA
jgi:hypothetical protein